MKKKILILAAIAVSGIAAVVASNVRNADAVDNCAGAVTKVEKYSRWWCCVPASTALMCDGYNNGCHILISCCYMKALIY